jgi:hypothetical protein
MTIGKCFSGNLFFKITTGKHTLPKSCSETVAASLILIRAAKLFGISEQMIRYKINKYGLKSSS